ncbi:MAG: hypothetical protein U0325_25570 [Polyangiales bacterium]
MRVSPLFVLVLVARTAACARSAGPAPQTPMAVDAERPPTPPPSPAAASTSAPSDPPPRGYAARRLAGFTVFVNDEVFAHPAVAEVLLPRVEASLAEVGARMGARRAAVAGVRVWIEWTRFQPERSRGVAEFHRSRAWLQANGYDPAKAQGIEINDARAYLDVATRTQPAVLLHEFAHAYEALALGDADPAITAAFEAARRSGRYEAVARAGGSTGRAYALVDAHEYFAELTEAYLAVNDFFPFVREQLREHDPDGFALLSRVWGPQPPRPAATRRPCEAPLASEVTGVSTAIVFENRAASPMDLWWVDDRGGRHHYARVAPGSLDVRQTYAGHAWLALDVGGRCIGAFVAGPSVERADLGAVGP